MCLLSSTLWAPFVIPLPLLRCPVFLLYPLIAAVHWIVQTWVHYCHAAPCWSMLLKSCYILRIWKYMDFFHYTNNVLKNQNQLLFTIRFFLTENKLHRNISLNVFSNLKLQLFCRNCKIYDSIIFKYENTVNMLGYTQYYH